METLITHRTNGKRFFTSLGLALLALLATVATAQAQSTDRDNPTPLLTNEIRGMAPGKKVEYYYTFLAGPGEVILTVDSGAKGSFSQLDAQFFDLDAEKLAQVQNLPYPGETSRKVTRANFGAQQPVLLRIFLDKEAAQYMVRVAGAVQLESPATLSPTPVATDASATTPGTPAETATPPVGSTESTPPPAASATPVSASEATATAPTATAGKLSGFQKLWMRLGSTGELLGLSKIGKLKIEMKDGTSQEIGLLKVKRIVAPKGEDPTSAAPANESWQRLWMKLGNAGELMNLAASGVMRVELQDGSTQQFEVSKIRKVSIKK